MVQNMASKIKLKKKLKKGNIIALRELSSILFDIGPDITGTSILKIRIVIAMAKIPSMSVEIRSTFIKLSDSSIFFIYTLLWEV
jgi:hypothetical protein